MFWCVKYRCIFLTCLYFDLPYRLVKIPQTSSKCTAILHTKTSQIYVLHCYISRGNGVNIIGIKELQEFRSYNGTAPCDHFICMMTITITT